MIVAVLAAAMTLGLAQQTDTTFAVPARGSLLLDAHNGSVIVRAWDRAQLRVQATHAPRARIDIRQSAAGRVVIEPEAVSGGPAEARLEITVPRAYSVGIDGVNFVVTVDGVEGGVAVDNVQGEITIRNIIGNVKVSSASATVTIEDVRGNINAETVEQSLFLTRVRGDINAETVNGGIVILGADATVLSAEAHNGLIQYDGTVRDGGRYQLSAHNGQITMSIPEGANAAVTVSTSNGRIDAAFPVPVRSMRDNSFTFTLGNGSARVSIESHNGTIRLVRPRDR